MARRKPIDRAGTGERHSSAAVLSDSWPQPARPTPWPTGRSWAARLPRRCSALGVGEGVRVRPRHMQRVVAAKAPVPNFVTSDDLHVLSSRISNHPEYLYSHPEYIYIYIYIYICIYIYIYVYIYIYIYIYINNNFAHGTFWPPSGDLHPEPRRRHCQRLRAFLRPRGALRRPACGGSRDGVVAHCSTTCGRE